MAPELKGSPFFFLSGLLINVVSVPSQGKVVPQRIDEQVEQLFLDDEIIFKDMIYYNQRT